MGLICGAKCIVLVALALEAVRRNESRNEDGPNDASGHSNRDTLDRRFNSPHGNMLVGHADALFPLALIYGPRSNSKGRCGCSEKVDPLVHLYSFKSNRITCQPDVLFSYRVVRVTQIPYRNRDMSLADTSINLDP